MDWNAAEKGEETYAVSQLRERLCDSKVFIAFVITLNIVLMKVKLQPTKDNTEFRAFLIQSKQS